MLTEFQPKLKFWLLDEGKFTPDYLESLQRVMAAIFLVERTGESLEAVKQAIRHFGRTVASSPFKKTIDKVVMQWLLFRLHSKLPGLHLPEVDDILKGTEMLETNIERLMKNAVAEGVLLGKLEGMQQGKLEGESALLERLVAKRFGPISDNIRTRLNTATAEQLETWAERLLDAATLAEVFGDH